MRAVRVLAVLGCGCGRVGFDTIGSGDAAPDMFTPDACGVLAHTWTLVPDGDFETDTVDWVLVMGGSGAFARVSTPVVAGSYSLKLQPSTVTALGYSAAVDVAVTPGQDYVLSGFLQMSQIPAGQNFYLDLDDATFDANLTATRGLPGWQFTYETVAIPQGVSLVTVRVVHDGFLTPVTMGFADEVAFTPATMFKPFAPCM